MSDGAQSEALQARREVMVVVQLRERGIRDQRVLEAMARVPRHEFVPQDRVADAYGDFPLPIGEGQTISQPYIVAAMLEALALREEDSVLEIGTGSGYQTAILCELCRNVYSVERYPSLRQQAEKTLKRLGYTNFELRTGDGSLGWPEAAPFDGIVVSAAVPRVPVTLFEQLREGGRLMLPVGSQFSQELQLIRKQAGVARFTHLDGCRFVPLVGSGGFWDLRFVICNFLLPSLQGASQKINTIHKSQITNYKSPAFPVSTIFPCPCSATSAPRWR